MWTSLKNPSIGGRGIPSLAPRCICCSIGPDLKWSLLRRSTTQKPLIYWRVESQMAIERCEMIAEGGKTSCWTALNSHCDWAGILGSAETTQPTLVSVVGTMHGSSPRTLYDAEERFPSWSMVATPNQGPHSLGLHWIDFWMPVLMISEAWWCLIICFYVFELNSEGFFILMLLIIILPPPTPTNVVWLVMFCKFEHCPVILPWMHRLQFPKPPSFQVERLMTWIFHRNLNCQCH